jgi:translation initiation factor 2 alpha subunit (eIF-2alpha)
VPTNSKEETKKKTKNSNFKSVKNNKNFLRIFSESWKQSLENAEEMQKSLEESNNQLIVKVEELSQNFPNVENLYFPTDFPGQY